MSPEPPPARGPTGASARREGPSGRRQALVRGGTIGASLALLLSIGAWAHFHAGLGAAYALAELQEPFIAGAFVLTLAAGALAGAGMALAAGRPAGPPPSNAPRRHRLPAGPRLPAAFPFEAAPRLPADASPRPGPPGLPPPAVSRDAPPAIPHGVPAPAAPAAWRPPLREQPGDATPPTRRRIHRPRPGRYRPVGRRPARGGRSVARILATTGAGAALGVLTFLAFWVMNNPFAGLPEVFASLPHSLLDAGSPLPVLVVAGGLAGLAAAVALSPRPVRGGLAQRAVGAVLGALAGSVIYSIAYVIRYHPHLPDPTSAIYRFAEGMYSFTPVEFLFVALSATVGFVVARYSWRLYGTVTLIALITAVSGYLLFSLTATLPALPDHALPVSLLLFAAEMGSLSMVVLYSFYTLDVATRKQWNRTPGGAEFSEFHLPKVAFQVPVYNEPPEMVLANLRRLLAMDYPEDRFVVMVGDDSTRPEVSAPLAEFCRAHRVLYVHRDDRRGYKAGALNELLRHTPADVDLIAVIDADYEVRSEYLRETVGYFADERLGWVQTPQDYRNRGESFLTEQYYLADSYFYRTVMPSRNEEGSIIFCGTMGILRREALEAVGGWGEGFVTEDAELSVRLVDGGWRSLYVAKAYGQGLIPSTFEAYKKQHYRWAFGGGKILRRRLARILFGRFTRRQKLDFFVGSVHWFEGVFILAIAGILLLLAFGAVIDDGFLVHHDKEILFVGLVPIFLLADGLTRLHMVLHKDLKLSLGGTIRVLGMWMSVKFSNTFGALKAFFGGNIPFVRTRREAAPRMGRAGALREALRVTPFESAMAGLFAVAVVALSVHTWLHVPSWERHTIGRVTMVAWLCYYGLLFSAAPLYAYKSYVRPRGAPTGAGVPLAPHHQVIAQ